MPCIRHGAGLLFCSDAIQPNTSVYSVFCRVNAIYTAHTAKQRTGLYRGFSYDCTRSTAHDNSPTQAAIMPLVTRWRAYTRPDALNRYQIPPPRRTLHRSAQTAYYNNVYKRVQGCALLWIHARRCSISQTMPAVAGQLLPCADRWQVLTVCQQYRPAAPSEGCSVSTCTRSARRLAVWHRVSSQGAPSTRRGSTAAWARRAARNHWRLVAASLFGLSPDSQ